MSNILQLVTHSAEETIALGRVFAGLVNPGTVIALDGDLASGKTTFVRGMAAHFAVGDPVHSPTFTLINEYGDTRKLFHLDLYRLGGPADVAELGYEDVLDAGGVSVVEWAGRAAGLLPRERIDIAFSHGGADTRNIAITDCGMLPEGWRDVLRRATTSP